jgi:hypothetical protein
MNFYHQTTEAVASYYDSDFFVVYLSHSKGNTGRVRHIGANINTVGTSSNVK